MMGSWHLIAAFGIYKLFELVKGKYLKIFLIVILILGYSLQFKEYLLFYFNEYPKKYAIDWQYGMKQIVEYVGEHPEYSPVYITDVHSQPYIFFLYYLKIPVSELLGSVYYADTDESRTYNTITVYDKYHFGGWNKAESAATPGTLYVLTANEYYSLKNRLQFKIDRLINYPDGTEAFFLISAL